MDEITKRRNEAINELLELAPRILLGSASETYRTCGNPNCRCHSTGPKHGPHMYVNYKGEHGRTTGYYVRKALVAWPAPAPRSPPARAVPTVIRKRGSTIRGLRAACRSRAVL